MENALHTEELDSPVWLTPSESSHRLESRIQRTLISQDVEIQGLVVRRTADGVCLEGFVNSGTDAAAICRALQEMDDIGEVQTRLVTRRTVR